MAYLGNILLGTSGCSSIHDVLIFAASIIKTSHIYLVSEQALRQMNYLAHLSKPFSGSGWIGGWSPGIGDPDIISWIIVALYALSAWQCYRVATLSSNSNSNSISNVKQGGDERATKTVHTYGSGASEEANAVSLMKWNWNNLLGKGERKIWWILVFGLTFLGINKQLDLQTALTEFGRILSEQQGWYEKRRQVQLFFTFGIAAITIFSAIALLFLARKTSFATQLTLAGAIWLLSFIFIRVAGFHHVELHLHGVFIGMKLKWVYEIIGICMIFVGARMKFKQLSH